MRGRGVLADEGGWDCQPLCLRRLREQHPPSFLQTRRRATAHARSARHERGARSADDRPGNGALQCGQGRSLSARAGLAGRVPVRRRPSRRQRGGRAWSWPRIFPAAGGPARQAGRECLSLRGRGFADPADGRHGRRQSVRLALGRRRVAAFEWPDEAHVTRIPTGSHPNALLLDARATGSSLPTPTTTAFWWSTPPQTARSSESACACSTARRPESALRAWLSARRATRLRSPTPGRMPWP